jgi:signal transduction histidine kinase
MASTIPKGIEIRVFELLGRLKWLTDLRWLAVAGVICVIEFSLQILKVDLNRAPLAACVAVMVAGNFIFAFLIKKLFTSTGASSIEDRAKNAQIIANIQIVFDLVLLTALLHFAGGIDNPFNFYYIFHIVIASMLLEPFHCYMQAALASALYSGLITLEHFNALSRYNIFETAACPLGGLKVAGAAAAFTTTMIIIAYITTSISERLRLKENLLLETNMKLVDLDVKKSEFVMVVAHELKSPLGTIQFMLKSLTGGYSGAVIDDKAREHIAKVETRAAGLLKLVTDLLDLSKIKTGFGAKEFTKVSFLEKLKKAVETMNVQAKAASVTIRETISGKDEDFIIDGDAEYLDNVIINVISNAVKYNHKDGTVDIVLERKDENLVFRCKDSGIGIPKEELASIFEEFHRTSISKKHTAMGTGVGMAITKKIVEYHNGSITVDSDTGKGSEFTITLPVNNKRIKND